MNLTDGTVRAQAGYSYDTAGRVATVGDGGDTLTYAYAPGTVRVASTAWTTATGNNTAYTYDSYHRLTGIAVNNTPVYGYTLNDKDQRTAATLENGDNWAYTYDTLGQLTGALKKDSQDNTLNNMSYAFDLIGNRTSAVEDATNWTYASNLLNQYTQVNALLPTYDADGNMLTWNGWTYTWNGENRLVCAESDDTKVEMSYDYMGRRFEKKVYSKGLLNLYTWTLQKHRKFAYDGYKLIAEFDAMNNDALLANYLWQPVGLDVPLRATIDGDACYFVADGNKNIIALKDATGATTDDYTYAPFGAVTASGSTDNPFRFSSEYYDAETDLVYYNFRYYSPVLGRWTKRDSSDENGGMNLYAMVDNNVNERWDSLGLWGLDVHEIMTAIIAYNLNYREHVSEWIGGYDVSVDGKVKGLIGTKSFVWNQGYHFNRAGAIDSRMYYFEKHMSKAKQLCAKRCKKPVPYYMRLEAAENLGVSLHPLQDWVAHGDYGKKQSYVTIIHNSQSPQKDFGDPAGYPDNVALDAIGSSDGRPTGNAIQDAYKKTSIKYIGATAIVVDEWVKAEFAYYRPGSKRKRKTYWMTENAPKAFKSYLKSSAADRGCRCFFLNDGA